MAITWQDLFTAGTLVDYSVHLWRARIQLKPEDLGIDTTTDIQQAFSFGCHRLAPASAFEDINACVRQWQKDIEDYSLAFPLLESVRFVPDDQVNTLQKKLDMRLREFNIAVEEFLENYDKTMTEMLPVLEQALVDAAKTPDAAQTALSRIISEYPSKEKVAAKFGLDWNFFTISLPTSKDAAITAKSALPQVQKAVSSMVEQLRNELSNKVENLLSLAKKAKVGKSRTKDGFGEKSRESAMRVLEKVDRLNFFGDTALKEQTNFLRSLLDSADSDLNAIVSDLDKVKANLEKNVEDAAQAAEKRLTGIGNRKIQV